MVNFLSLTIPTSQLRNDAMDIIQTFQLYDYILLTKITSREALKLKYTPSLTLTSLVQFVK